MQGSAITYAIGHLRYLSTVGFPVKDTAYVDACPVDCIHPKKNTTYDDGRPTFDEVSQLYIDPIECIDCGACVPVCPVSAIFALDDLPDKWKHFTEINASYVQGGKFTPEEFAKHTPSDDYVAEPKQLRDSNQLFRTSKAREPKPAPRGYLSLSYSALASFRMGMSGSASFQRARNS
jgi:NAD-dependent dihydropyrimidine dehydrogenase PreA subunit